MLSVKTCLRVPCCESIHLAICSLATADRLLAQNLVRLFLPRTTHLDRKRPSNLDVWCLWIHFLLLLCAKLYHGNRISWKKLIRKLDKPSPSRLTWQIQSALAISMRTTQVVTEQTVNDPLETVAETDKLFINQIWFLFTSWKASSHSASIQWCMLSCLITSKSYAAFA